MSLRAAIFALPFAVAACATPNPSSTAAATNPGETLTPETVAGGFRTAVLDVCLTSLMNGTPVADLATETGPIVPETSSAIRSAPGDTLWAPRAAKGSVSIKANASECQVQAYGPPVAKTIEAVRQGLSDPHGFVLDPQTAARQGVETHTKKIGDKMFTVILSSPEAGSRVATLNAVVTAKPSA